MPYEPTLESLRAHPLPGWFADAKLGIFIHWGVFSIPAWAPMTGGMFDQADPFRNTPYTEWYLNSLALEGSPVQAHHRETYGADYPYDTFAPQFKEADRGVGPDDLGRPVRGRGCSLRRARHQASRRLPPVAQRDTEPVQVRMAERPRPRGRARRRGASTRPHLWPLLLRRPRLDVRRARHRLDAHAYEGDPAERRVRALRRRALA